MLERGNVGTSLKVIWILAILGFLLTILFLVLPGTNLGKEWADRAQAGATTSSAFALILSIISVVVSVRISSSDYKAEQDVRANTVQLLASIRSILIKSALLSQNSKSTIDFKNEHKVINTFLSSTTAFAYWSWVSYKSEHAGSNPEEWRVFFLYLGSILDTDVKQYVNMAKQSIKVEKLLTQLTQSDIRQISNYVLNLSESIARFKEGPQDTLTKAIFEVWGDDGIAFDKNKGMTQKQNIVSSNSIIVKNGITIYPDGTKVDSHGTML
ncbi:MAG: hypothetical protein ACREAD_04225 [Nitrosopumilaceae archaeon]